MKVRYDHVSIFVARQLDGRFELLQLRRSATEDLGGTWQTVRGSMETGETSIQTALRELREETALSPTELYSLGIVETFFIAGADTVFHSPSFLAIVQADAKIVLDREHDDHRWVTLTDAGQYFTWPSEKPLLDCVADLLLENRASKPLLLIRP